MVGLTFQAYGIYIYLHGWLIFRIYSHEPSSRMKRRRKVSGPQKERIVFQASFFQGKCETIYVPLQISLARLRTVFVATFGWRAQDFATKRFLPVQKTLKTTIAANWIKLVLTTLTRSFSKFLNTISESSVFPPRLKTGSGSPPVLVLASLEHLTPQGFWRKKPRWKPKMFQLKPFMASWLPCCEGIPSSLPISSL